VLTVGGSEPTKRKHKKRKDAFSQAAVSFKEIITNYWRKQPPQVSHWQSRDSGSKGEGNKDLAYFLNLATFGVQDLVPTGFAKQLTGHLRRQTGVGEAETHAILKSLLCQCTFSTVAFS
jgi:hypothetical protein